MSDNELLHSPISDADEIRGDISRVETIDVDLTSAEKEISGTISPLNEVKGSITYGVGKGENIRYYDGSYNVTPSGSETILNTKNKMMLDDVTVRGISYIGADNSSGGGGVFVDLTSDTVAPQYLKYGIVAHNKTGAMITGTSQFFPIDAYEFDYNTGRVDDGVWQYESPTDTYADIYQVNADNTYLISLGGNVGSCFIAMFTAVDVTALSGGNATGTTIININSPTPHRNTTYECPSDGYIIVVKDDVGKQGVKSYVHNMTLGWT